MKRIAIRVAFSFAFLIVASGGAFATTNIVSLSADTLDTGFNAGTGVFSADDDADIVVELADTSQDTYVGGHFSLVANMLTDMSSGGVAKASFGGGQIVVKDSSNMDLLIAELLDLVLEEAVVQQNLVGLGSFRVTGGSLAFDIVAVGQVVDLTFNLSPSNLSDFQSSFTGESNVTLLGDLEGDPIPEPLTVLGMILAVGSVGGYMRRKRA